jgi:hypothetical protein
MNCTTCKNYSGTCGNFPPLSEWKGDGFGCWDPRDWDAPVRRLSKSKPIVSSTRLASLFNAVDATNGDNVVMPEAICSNIVCSKRSWCCEEIAERCKKFSPMVEVRKISCQREG